MLRKIVFSFAVLGLALASAKSFQVNLSTPALAGNTELKAGNYEVSVSGQNAVIRGSKVDNQVPVKVETVDRKYDETSVKYSLASGKKQIQEIHLGGTKTKLVFSEAAPLP
ncbi:MAG TPA: hypothetical protein VG456_28275 [Candidatus Sulfopaludibacter sp.]|jgi:hypothetical protein|nr:hypothetical protein [Candidatus Sulfopaludibacter sp.]